MTTPPEVSTNKKILIIDDDLEVLNMLVDYISYMGYVVDHASDGLEGLKKIKENGYALIITDLSMPYVSGIGIISVIKKSQPEVPVIAITGFGYYAEELAHEKRADAILSKPFDIQQLKGTIISLLGD